MSRRPAGCCPPGVVGVIVVWAGPGCCSFGTLDFAAVGCSFAFSRWGIVYVGSYWGGTPLFAGACCSCMAMPGDWVFWLFAGDMSPAPAMLGILVGSCKRNVLSFFFAYFLLSFTILINRDLKISNKFLIKEFHSYRSTSQLNNQISIAIVPVITFYQASSFSHSYL